MQEEKMGLRKLILIVGIAAAVMQPTDSATIGDQGSSCMCSREYFPICASNGITYSNECLFNCAKEQNKDLDIRFYGECIEDHSLPAEEEAIEIVDGVINVENLPAKDGFIEIHNVSTGEEANACLCTLIYEPVCGSDGQTYSSECDINCAKKFNQNLEVLSKGECIHAHNLPASEEPDTCVCTLEHAPICGNDGQTYSNQCEFDCIKKFNKNLEVSSKGVCIQIQNIPAQKFYGIHHLPADREAIACLCTLDYAPICGSDGQTYSNECEFKCVKKYNRNLEIFSKSECFQFENFPAEEELCICSKKYQPVCGSDGRTYSNLCLMRCEQHNRSDLKFKHSGAC